MTEPKAGERVYADQVRLLYQLSGSAYVGTLVNASILVFALWGAVSSTLLGAWLCLMYLVTGARFLLYRAYHGLRPPDEEATGWAWRFLAGAATSGLLWGAAGSLLFPVSSVPLQFLVIFLIGGMATAAMVVLAPVRRVFFAFVLPALSLLCVTVFIQGTTLHFYMGALILVYLALVVSLEPIISRTMRDALRMRFDNAALVERLSAANRELSDRINTQERADEVLRQSEQRYRHMFEANPLPMWIRDERTMLILAVNEAALQRYGYARDEFTQLKPADILVPEDLDSYFDALQQHSSSRSFTLHVRHRRRDGSVMEVEAVSHSCELDGHPARLTLVNDITERKRVERRLQMGHTLTRILAEARSVEEALPQAMRTICESGGWVYAQRWQLEKSKNLLSCAEVWHSSDAGLDEFEALNRTRTQTPGGGRRGLIHRVWECNETVWVADLIADGQMYRGPAALRAGLRSAFAFPVQIGGSFYGVLEFFAREVGEPDKALMEIAGTFGSQIGQFMARKAAEQNLRFVASHDPLTGLFNRAMFNERMQQALAQAARFERSLSLLFIDLDGFKSINDTLGHNAGDALLTELAVRLRATLREGDVIGRIGGDEFVVLIEEVVEASQVAEVAKKVLDTIARPFVFQGHECAVTASVGISLYPGDGKDAQTLLRNADTAMYLVKRQGKHAFRFYSTQMNEHWMERLSLESGLRDAMERGELVLRYQPKVAVRTGVVRGVETLMHWQHPTKGLIGQREFMPVVEDAGLIAALGEWVLNTACRQVRAWRDQGLPLLRVAVDLSPKQFLQDGLTTVLRKSLRDAGLEPDFLELEITEEMLIRNSERITGLLAEIKEIGARVVIDDFGKGYSSPGFLRRLPIDGVKIDGSLIAGLVRDPDATALTRGVIAMARSLGITVAAEGVETREQCAFLGQAACEEMQGDYFSPPVAADGMPAVLREEGNVKWRFNEGPSRPGRKDDSADA